MAKRETTVNVEELEELEEAQEGENVTGSGGREVVRIKAPKFEYARIRIIGTSPYVQNKFSSKARQQIHDTQAAGSRSSKGSAREAKDFQALYEGAKHVSTEGWYGLPASAFRKAMVSACRTVGFKMTLAKLCLFVVADGFDRDDHTPLVRITKGEPEYSELPVNNDDGSRDLRARPFWQPGWEAVVMVRYDADQFALSDVVNLMMRVGMQVGIGEGRHDSKKSTGMGWGEFAIAED